MLLLDEEIKQLIISAGWILTGAKLNHMIADYKVALQVQHERSYAAGRRELVEWLEKHKDMGGFKAEFYLCIPLEDWLALRR